MTNLLGMADDVDDDDATADRFRLPEFIIIVVVVVGNGGDDKGTTPRGTAVVVVADRVG